jgi:hypothetical protein
MRRPLIPFSHYCGDLKHKTLTQIFSILHCTFQLVDAEPNQCHTTQLSSEKGMMCTAKRKDGKV